MSAHPWGGMWPQTPVVSVPLLTWKRGESEQPPVWGGPGAGLGPWQCVAIGRRCSLVVWGSVSWVRAVPQGLALIPVASDPVPGSFT